MTLEAGSRIRFSATFRDVEGKPFDPTMVVAMVSTPSGISSFTLGHGVRRDELGKFSVVVLVDRPGKVRVKFASTFAGEESTKVSEFVVEDSLAAGPEVVEQAPPPPDPSVLVRDSDDLEHRRMVDELRASGACIDASKSKAYVRAMYEALAPRIAEQRQVRSDWGWGAPLPSSRLKRR